MSKAEEIERLEELRRSGTLTDSLVTRRSESAGDPTSQLPSSYLSHRADEPRRGF